MKTIVVPRVLESVEMNDANSAFHIESVPEAANLSDRLEKLSEAAFILSLTLASEELKHRCSVLASGAQVAASLLTQLPRTGHGNREIHREAALISRFTSEGIETKLLYELGWSAMELSLKTEGLAVLQMVGTLLHGKLGGSVFKVESLLAIGEVAEATALYRSEVTVDPGSTELADAIFSSLWRERGDGLWRGLKAGNSALAQTLAD